MKEVTDAKAKLPGRNNIAEDPHQGKCDISKAKKAPEMRAEGAFVRVEDIKTRLQVVKRSLS